MADRLLGADTPAESVAETAERLRPALTVVNAVTPDALRREAPVLARLAADNRVAIAGAGADAALAGSLGSELLESDPVAAAAL